MRPKLPAGVAESLAARSDAVAERLEAGDGCAADQEAELLQREAVAAVNAGSVPPALQEELLSAVNAIAGEIVCEPPPRERDEDEDGDD